ncbi:MAG: hypothetical protein AAF449_14825 [Myxococcota bacterium]
MDARSAPFQFSPPGRALFHFRAGAGELQAKHGPPHYAPEGPRRLPAWGFEFADGLILELQLNEHKGLCYVHGPLRELRYAIMLLGVEDRIAWRMDDDWAAFERALEAYHPADWGRWIVRSGEQAIECLSPGEARWRRAQIEASGEGPVSIEETPQAAARTRRKRILRSGPAQRRLPGESDRVSERWEVWQVGPGEQASLLAMYAERRAAEGFREERQAQGPTADVRYEVRLRAR